MMLVRKRILPSRPPSLVKLSFSDAAVRSGSSISAPSNAQVPALMYAQLPEVGAGTAPTALAVSWLPTLMIGIGPQPSSR